MAQNLRDAVAAAAARPEVRQAVSAIYQEVDRRVAQRRPLCIISGRCCRFDEYGHRLFATTAELALFSHELSLLSRKFEPEPASDLSGGACPFQARKLCGVHAIRPFGCRLFFCDTTSTLWQNETYEQVHGQLRRLHDTLRVPYFYTEWRAALRELGLCGEARLPPLSPSS